MVVPARHLMSALVPANGREAAVKHVSFVYALLLSSENCKDESLTIYEIKHRFYPVLVTIL